MKRLLLALSLLLCFGACLCTRWPFGEPRELALVKNANEGQKVNRTELLDAIIELGEDKEHKAAEPLMTLMKTTKDLAIGNACLSALSELNHPKIMEAIIDFVERKPAIVRRQAILAARKIANKTAAEWLLVMAYGHEDATVRREAQLALDEVEKKLGLSNG